MAEIDDAYIKRALDDRDWWMEFGNRLGWQLYGFNYREVATFRLKSGAHVEVLLETRIDIERTWNA